MESNSQNQSPWHPIDTAPRDGQFIDVWVVSKSGGASFRITSVQWDADAKDWRGFTDEGDEYLLASPPSWASRLATSPTHWMPRPAPPA